MRLMPFLTALIVAAGFLFWIVREPTRAAPAPAEAAAAPAAVEDMPVAVVALHASAETVATAIVMRGRTEAFRKVQVMSQVSGLVISLPRRSGTVIAKGDVLCEIDPADRLVALNEARAWLAEADARNRAAAELSKRGYAAETSAMSTRAGLETAQMRVQRAEIEITRLRIAAPFDGLLETDTAEIGALLQPGLPCATLIALDPIKLVGFVPERDVGRLEPGLPAGARLADGREARGTISFVSRSADELTRTFRVEITVANPDNAIRDGQTAEILVPLAGARGHFLPQSALTLDDGGRLGVRIAEDGRARFVAVTILQDDAKGVWVTGLPEVADVIVVGQEYVSDGRLVTVTRAERSALK
jgi:multidrug efflux system membrane fusion protein